MGFLAGKTGLTPNLLFRLGFCLSLNEPTVPNPGDYPEEDREFNRYTLLGEYDAMFIALLTEHCIEQGVPLDEMPDIFRAHLNRGAILLQNRVRSIVDVTTLALSEAAR